MVKDRIKELDVRFETVPYTCSRCGYKGEEVIVVANDTGILDTECPKCKKRIVEFKVLEGKEEKAR